MMTSLGVVVEGSLPATGMNQLLSSNKKIIYFISQKAWTLCWKMILTQAFTSHSYGVLGNLVN
jgi:hypothetical protein